MPERYIIDHIEKWQDSNCKLPIEKKKKTGMSINRKLKHLKNQKRYKEAKIRDREHEKLINQ